MSKNGLVKEILGKGDLAAEETKKDWRSLKESN